MIQANDVSMMTEIVWEKESHSDYYAIHWPSMPPTDFSGAWSIDGVIPSDGTYFFAPDTTLELKQYQRVRVYTSAPDQDGHRIREVFVYSDRTDTICKKLGDTVRIQHLSGMVWTKVS